MAQTATRGGSRVAGEEKTRQRRRSKRQAEGSAAAGGHLKAIGAVVGSIWALVRAHPALRAYFFANALWELALAALKAFIVLYLTVGLHYKLATSSLIIGGVAVIILIGAAAAGKLGDRLGPTCGSSASRSGSTALAISSPSSRPRVWPSGSRRRRSSPSAGGRS